MRRITLALLLLTLSACKTDICWPSSIPEDERSQCPPSHPYRNKWHPNYCYDTPQDATP
jgi:hypothetical protein